jgi:hypothetical protein
MGASLYDASLLEHQDPIHVFHPHEPVGDNEGGAVPRWLVSRIQQLVLRHGGEIGGRFVQHDKGYLVRRTPRRKMRGVVRATILVVCLRRIR